MNMNNNTMYMYMYNMYGMPDFDAPTHASP